MIHELFTNYSIPFFVNSNKKIGIYKENVQSDMIILLFNLNRSLSLLILSDIFFFT
ncbi:MAG: hypothetical protein ACRCUM_00205 [Mycoplasmoidaceae bacterium]